MWNSILTLQNVNVKENLQCAMSVPKRVSAQLRFHSAESLRVFVMTRPKGVDCETNPLHTLEHFPNLTQLPRYMTPFF